MDRDPTVSTVTNFGWRSSHNGSCTTDFVVPRSGQVLAATAAQNVVGPRTASAVRATADGPLAKPCLALEAIALSSAALGVLGAPSCAHAVAARER